MNKTWRTWTKRDRKLPEPSGRKRRRKNPKPVFFFLFKDESIVPEYLPLMVATRCLPTRRIWLAGVWWADSALRRCSARRTTGWNRPRRGAWAAVSGNQREKHNVNRDNVLETIGRRKGEKQKKWVCTARYESNWQACTVHVRKREKGEK